MSSYIFQNQDNKFFKNETESLLVASDEIPEPVLDLNPTHAEMVALYQDGDAIHTFANGVGTDVEIFQDVVERQPTFRTNRLNGLPGIEFGMNTSLKLSHEILPKTILVVWDHHPTAYQLLLSPANPTSAGIRGYSITGPLIWNANWQSAFSGDPIAQVYIGDIGPLPITKSWSDAAYTLTSMLVSRGQYVNRIGGYDGTSDWSLKGTISRLLVYDVRLTHEQVLTKIQELNAVYNLDRPKYLIVPPKPTPVPMIDLDANSDQMVSTYQDGDKIATWFTNEGNGMPAIQGDAAHQPIFRTNQVNGLPAVEFSASLSSYLTFPHTTNSVRTLFIVLQLESFTLQNLLNPQNVTYGYVINNNTFSYNHVYYALQNGIAHLYVNDLGPMEIWRQWNIQGFILLAVTTPVGTGVNVMGAYQNGATINSFLEAKVARLLAYDQVLTAQEINAKTQELMAKYGLRAFLS